MPKYRVTIELDYNRVIEAENEDEALVKAQTEVLDYWMFDEEVEEVEEDEV